MAHGSTCPTRIHRERMKIRNGGYPAQLAPAVDATYDFFVVVRPDSGYEDASGILPDGTGIQFGADFRAFVGPREYNALTGLYEGGLRFSNQTQPVPFPETDLPELLAKPVSAIVDVHDLVSVYSSYNVDFSTVPAGYRGDPQYFAYETVPFDFFEQGLGLPRSPFFDPPAPPIYPVGPAVTPIDQYPRASNFDATARVLRQRVEINSPATAILGFNLCNTPDTVTSAINQLRLTQLRIFVFGDGFDPAD